MSHIRVTYEGELRTTAEHLMSSHTLVTDAPPDNNGKGEAFAPSDLVATAAASCMITSMAIIAESNGLQMGKIESTVDKLMTPTPRRIGQLKVELMFIDHNLSETDKTLLENAALSCPVTRSLHPDVVVNVKFRYQ
jgi:putative redox protein